MNSVLAEGAQPWTCTKHYLVLVHRKQNSTVMVSMQPNLSCCCTPHIKARIKPAEGFFFPSKTHVHVQNKPA